MTLKLAAVLAVGFVSLASIAPAHAYQCKHLSTTASSTALPMGLPLAQASIRGGDELSVRFQGFGAAWVSAQSCSGVG